MSDILKVSELVNSIKKNLEQSFCALSVEGEISNYSLSSAGHIYFSLSDKDAILSCALFKMDAMRNPILREIKDGAKVVCLGEISVYSKRGTFQLIVRKIILASATGDLSEKFEKLKKKLAAEGLFDLERKRPIPKMPRKIGLITALQGAALQDFINISKRRSTSLNLLIIPAMVQGELSAQSLLFAFKKAVSYHDLNKEQGEGLDVIVLSRGGGSKEDLASFNDELLAYEIAKSPVPTISAVGHQVDFTICDFVADFRAETPSAAAEKLSEYQLGVEDRLQNCAKKMQLITEKWSLGMRHKLERGHPLRINNILNSRLNILKNKLMNLDISKRWHELLPLHQNQMHLDDLVNRLQTVLTSFLLPQEKQLDRLNEILKALDPKAVLKRGYSLLSDQNNQLVTNYRSFSNFKKGDKLIITFGDGSGVILKED